MSAMRIPGFAAILLLYSSLAASGAEPAYDLLLRNGKIVDGSGNPWYIGDVAVRAGRIVAVGRVPAGSAKREIDVKGLAVAPGFIDMHSHSDYVLLEDGDAQSKIRQGVTTEVLGEGTSGGPYQGKLSPRRATIGGRSVAWTSFAGYLQTVEKATVSVIVESCKVVARHGGIYSSHIRNEGAGVFDAVKEAITIGERAGVPVDIIHLKIADQKYWGRMNEVVALIEDARKRGVNVQANVYPYTRGSNNLASIVPPWAHEGGTARMLARLRDPRERARMKTDIREGLPGW